MHGQMTAAICGPPEIRYSVKIPPLPRKFTFTCLQHVEGIVQLPFH